MKKFMLALAFATVTAVTASATPITGSFSLGLSSGSYMGPNGSSATAMTATGLDFGMSSFQGGTGTGNGFGTNGSAVIYNATGSFASLNNSFASVADILLGANGLANPYTQNPFITLGNYTVSFTDAAYTRSPLGTSVTVTGTANYSDGIAADGSTGTFSLSTSSQDGNSNSVQFTFTGNNSAATSTAVTPEPNSLALLGTGLLGLAGAVRKRLAR